MDLRAPSFSVVLARHSTADRVMVAGDWHARLLWSCEAVEKSAAAGASLLLHVGDFNSTSDKLEKRYLSKLDDACEEAGVDIFVTLGNHEPWGRLTKLWENPKRRDARGNPLPLSLGTRHLWMLPRPHRFMVGGVDFLSMGGAASVNFDQLTEGADWFPEEDFTAEELQRAVDGGPATVVLTHESPDPPYATPRVRHMLSTNAMGFSLEGLGYSAASRLKLTRALEAISPRLLFHGHMHTSDRAEVRWPGSEEPGLVVSLSAEHSSGNLFLLELDELRSGQ